MKYKKIIILILAALLISGCSPANTSKTSPSDSSNNGSSDIQPMSTQKTYSTDNASSIDLSTGSAEITKSGVYTVSGTLSDGSVTVNVDKTKDEGTVVLILNSVNITSQSTAPINIKEAKNVEIVLEGSNSLTQGADIIVDESSNPSAALFSKADLVISGSGSLDVNTEFNDGICSKDDLIISSGKITVNAKSDGLVGKDILQVDGGEITVTAGKDGIRSTNSTDAGKGNIIINAGDIKITADNDGMQAAAQLTINSGNFDIITGGGYPGQSVKTENSGQMPGKGGGMRNNAAMPGTPPTNPPAGLLIPPVANTSEQSDNIIAQSLVLSAHSQPVVADISVSAPLDTSTEESAKGIKSDGSIEINGGEIKISSYDDAVHSTGKIILSGGNMNIKSGDDGIHSDSDIEINSGNLDITGYEGIEGINITINNGKINLKCSDDGMNVNDRTGTLTINGGDIYLDAQGDGLDSNGNVVMTGSTLYIDGTTSGGNSALDYDGTFKISGGTMVSCGSMQMAMAPQGEQFSIMMSYSSSQNADTKITLKNSAGDIVASFTPTKTYQSAVISSPDIVSGQTYSLFTDETKIVEFITSSSVTYVNESGLTTAGTMRMGGGNRTFQPTN